jgi:DNA-binding transcriptional LysR family regulator
MMESLRGMVSFVQTARLGSFVRAAQALGVSSVAVSRNVARLEAQLGVRLFARTTRALSLTAEGSALLAQCEAPLEQLATAFSASRAAADAPSGRVRVTAVSPFVRAYLAPQLPAFHARYPQVELDIELSEQVADMVADRFDVGIRVGPLRDANFVARPLGPLALALCAAPTYLARAGVPQQVADLAQHTGLALKLTGAPAAAPWTLQSDQNSGQNKGPQSLVQLPVNGPLRCNDLLALLEACCAGLGLAQLPLVVALPALRAGRLQVVLPHTAPQGLQLFMHYPDRQLPARVRVFVDFCVALMKNHPDLDVPAAQFAARPIKPSVAKAAVKPASKTTAKPSTARVTQRR